MTPRERWLAVLHRQTPDRAPMDYWGTPEATAMLCRHLGCDDEWALFENLQIDRPVAVAPAGMAPPAGGGYDVFGCRWQLIPHATGAYLECVEHPLAKFDSLAELQRDYRWPTCDEFDYSVIRQQVAGKEDYPVQGGGSEPFLLYTELRGLERAYRDLLTRRDLVEHCLDKLFDLAHDNTRRIYEQIPGRVTYSYVAEDFGSQEGLLFNPKLIRELFIPRMKRMVDLVHSAGAFVVTHSDGAIRDIISDLIEIGVDVLNPIQWRCRGMDRAALKRDFGDRLVFHGGVDNQQTLVSGSPDDVRREVADNLRILGAGGGYILAPCHNIQAVSPPENVVALYEAGLELGKC